MERACSSLSGANRSTHMWSRSNKWGEIEKEWKERERYVEKTKKEKVAGKTKVRESRERTKRLNCVPRLSQA